MWVPNKSAQNDKMLLKIETALEITLLISTPSKAHAYLPSRIENKIH